jgi:hypothetical protein
MSSHLNASVCVSVAPCCFIFISRQIYSLSVQPSSIWNLAVPLFHQYRDISCNYIRLLDVGPFWFLRRQEIRTLGVFELFAQWVDPEIVCSRCCWGDLVKIWHRSYGWGDSSEISVLANAPTQLLLVRITVHVRSQFSRDPNLLLACYSTVAAEFWLRCKLGRVHSHRLNRGW